MADGGDTLRSAQYAEIVDIISEGPCLGLINGHKSVFFDGVPLQNDDGSYNFDADTDGDAVRVLVREGTRDQTPFPGVKAVENEIPVGVQVRKDTPIVRTISDDRIDVCRVTIAVAQLSHFNDDGGQDGYSFDWAIELQSNGGGYSEVMRETVTGKITSPYTRSKRIELTGDAPWDIRVKRLSDNNTDSKTANDFSWSSYAEIQSLRLSMPNTAAVWTRVGAKQFQRIPARSFEWAGLKVKVPTNYDPIAGTYDGIWDGTFKIAWTCNPAWVYYDMVTNRRYGAGQRIVVGDGLKWDLYRIGRYCDELVPDGNGGMEPRFVINVALYEQAQATQLLQDLAAIFRGMSYWAASDVAVTQDAPSDPVALFTPANVIDGVFNYQTTSNAIRYSSVVVWWNARNDQGKRKPEVYVDKDLVARYGVKPLELSPIGVWSRSQAHRIGRWALYSQEFETEVVGFSVGLDGVLVAPGRVFQIADPATAGERLGGRVVSATTQQVTLDAPVTLANGEQYTLTVMVRDPSDSTKLAPEQRNVTNAAGSTSVIAVSPALTAAPASGTVWVLQSNAVAATTWRCLTVREVEDQNQYEITALAHNPSKYAFIEQGIKLDSRPITRIKTDAPKPTNLHLAEVKYMDGAVPRSRVNASWKAPASGLRYEVGYRYGKGNWQSLPDTTDLSVDVEALPGQITVRVRSVNAIGNVSAYVSATLQVEGKTALPSRPTGLDAVVGAGGWTVSVDEPPDADWTILEVRLDGTSWSDAQPLFKIRGTKGLMPFMSAGVHVLRARHWAGLRLSAEATKTIQVDAPSAPIVSSLLRSVGSIEFRYNDCAGTQPLRGVLFRVGTVSQQWAAAAEAGAAGAGQLSHTIVFPATGTHRVFIRGQDAYGNLGEISFADVVALAQDTDTILGLIEGSVSESELAQRLAQRIDLIDAASTVAGSVAARLASEAQQRAAAISQAIDQEVHDRIADINDAIDQEVADRTSAISAAVSSEATSRTTADSAEASSRQTLSTLLIGTPNASSGQSLGGLSAGLLKDERDLRTTADASEASSRETLAAQMRGNYEGTDLSQVTDGLIAAERSARVTADSAIAQQISLLTAGVAGGFDPKQIWYFDQAGNAEGWVAANATISVSGGALTLTSTSANPQLRSASISVDGATYSTVKARLTRLAGSAWDGSVYYTTSGHGYATGYRKTIADPGLDVGESATLEWEMSALTAGGSDWVNGAATAIRLDLGASSSDVFKIDWIGVGRNAPGASQAAIADEETARATADAAEVSARQALSVKMTGVVDPSTKTLGTLAAGLVFDERTARVTADSAQVSRISSLEAAVTDPNTGLTATASQLDSVQLVVGNGTTGNAALGARTSQLESKISNVRRWSNSASVNGASPLVDATLKMADGTTALQNGEQLFGSSRGPLVYRVSARTLGVSTSTGAVAIFTATYGTAWTWSLRIINEVGNSGVHPQLYLDGGVPSVRLYSSTTQRTVAYDVEVDIGGYSVDAKIETDYYTAAETDSAIASQVNAVSARLNSGGDVFSSIVQVDTKATAAQQAAATAASQITSVQSVVDANATWKQWRIWDFVGSLQSWTAANATLSVGASSCVWETTAANPSLSITLDPADRFDGSVYTSVRVYMRRYSGSAPWEGTLLFSTLGHGIDPAYRKVIAAPPSMDDWYVYEWDMTDLTAGGSNWLQATITGLRIDPVSASGDAWKIDWIAVGAPLQSPASAETTQLSASVQQEISTRANQTGYLGAQWSVQAQLMSNGQPAIGGVALSGTSTPEAGPTFDFAVRSNKVYFLPPAGVADTKYSAFVYYSTVTTINGVVIQPGLYVRNAFIDFIKADQIDTRNLKVRDADGSVILGAGTKLGTPYIVIGAVSANVKVKDVKNSNSGVVDNTASVVITSTGGYLRVVFAGYARARSTALGQMAGARFRVTMYELGGASLAEQDFTAATVRIKESDGSTYDEISMPISIQWLDKLAAGRHEFRVQLIVDGRKPDGTAVDPTNSSLSFDASVQEIKV